MIAEKEKRETELLINPLVSPCVSIILPTHTRYPHFKEDQQKLKKMLQKAEDYLGINYTEATALPLISKVYEIANSIDFNFHSRSKGLGIFVSSDTTKIVHFPFDVKEKMVIGSNFETRDIILADSYQLDYWVLCLNERSLRLFKGKGMELIEVKDGDFPTEFVDDFDEPKPSRGSSYSYSLKGVKDKSLVKEERFTAFLRIIDKKLQSYLDIKSKIILSGVKKNINYFEKISEHNNKIIAKVDGNHDYENLKIFSDLLWDQVMNYLANENEKIFKQFVEAFDTGWTAWGIESVWKAAKEGKGLTLLVEKDFSHSGFLGKNEYKLLHQPPNGLHKIIADAVDDVIETILKKGGKVVFLENGKLKDYNNIGLLLRYKEA